MESNYSGLGLGTNLLKQLPKIYDVDLAIDDESIWGIKLAKKSVALDRLYGDNLQIGGSSNISGYVSIYNSAMAKISQIDDTGYHGYDTSGTERVTLDSTYGIKVLDDSSNNVLKTIISGANVGDVQIGTYDGSSGIGAYYDKSLSTFKVSGTITAGSIQIGISPSWFNVDSSGNMWSGRNSLAQAITDTFAVTNAGVLYAQQANIRGTISASTITGSTINGSTITGGTITGGTISSTSGNDRIVITTGDTLDFYQGGALRARIRPALTGLGVVAQTGSYVTAAVGEGFFVSASVGNYGKMYGSGGDMIFEAPAGGTENVKFMNSTSGSNRFTITSDAINFYEDLKLKDSAGSIYQEGTEAFYIRSTTSGGNSSFYPYWGDFYTSGTKFFRIPHPKHPDTGAATSAG